MAAQRGGKMAKSTIVPDLLVLGTWGGEGGAVYVLEYE
jgi:hypothetical protein